MKLSSLFCKCFYPKISNFCVIFYSVQNLTKTMFQLKSTSILPFVKQKTQICSKSPIIPI